MTTLIATAKLNDVDPLAWLADVLARIADMPQSRLAELLPSSERAALLGVHVLCACNETVATVAQNPRAEFRRRHWHQPRAGSGPGQTRSLPFRRQDPERSL